jgi:putative aldouronate transport system substrate-binding protein
MKIQFLEVLMKAKSLWLKLVLAVCLAGSVYGAGNKDSVQSGGQGPGKYPGYLNTGDVYPVVKPGETVTLTTATVITSQNAKPEEIWFWKFIEKKMNIKFQVEQILNTAAEERKALMFASGDIPDLVFGMPVTALDLVTYGQTENQLYNIKELLNPDLAPNMLASINRNPAAGSYTTTPDGGMYAFPNILYPIDVDSPPQMVINVEFLAKAGLKKPDTLEELYEALKTFKEKDPSGTGKTIPLGGSFRFHNPVPFLLNALGFLVLSNADPSEPALRNGQTVIPAGSPVYRDYLDFMRRLYREGLIDENFFIMDQNQVNAQIAEKRVGLIGTGGVYTILTNPDDYKKYEALSPLTSPQNQKRQTAKAINARIGAVMSAKTRYPEVAMRFMDYVYTREGNIYAWNGPTGLKKEDTLGLTEGMMYNNFVEDHPEVASGQYANPAEFIRKRLSPFPGRIGDFSDVYNDRLILSGFEPVKENERERVYNVDTPNGFINYTRYKNVWPYTVEGYPSSIFFSPEENTRVSDLKTVITDYVQRESAKFITGAKSLNNIDAYYRDLNALGLKEYENLYVKAYEVYLRNRRQ